MPGLKEALNLLVKHPDLLLLLVSQGSTRRSAKLGCTLRVSQKTQDRRCLFGEQHHLVLWLTFPPETCEMVIASCKSLFPNQHPMHV